MNTITPFKTPATFTLEISEEDSDCFDQSKSHYHCDISCRFETNDIRFLKVIAVKSPIFSKDANDEKFRAYDILTQCIAESVTRALLPVKECPQYNLIDGVLTPCDDNDDLPKL